MRARQVETDKRIDQLLTAMAHLSQLTQPSESISVPKPSSAPTLIRARPATPPEFDRDRKKGMAFLNSCQTYIRLCPSEFPDEQTKIVWAINCLESTAYYQKGRPLDEYIDEFQDLVADSGYSDPKTIVVKFRKGLGAQIQNSVATMASGRPSDASPNAWYTMARVVDQNRAANKAFTATYRTVPSASRQTPAPLPRTALPIVRPVHAHLHPSPGNPVPMDLDAARNAPVAPRCFRCKLPGHFCNNCPSCHNVWMMTTKELEEVIQQQLIRLDTPQLAQLPMSEGEPEIHKDFQPNNK